MDTATTTPTITFAQEVLSTFNSFSGGALFGAIVVAVLQHFFENSRSHNQRKSDLQKEIYFKLQEQAEKLIFEVSLADRRAKEISEFIQSDSFGQPPHDVSIIDRVERVSTASLYFSPDVIQKYNSVMEVFNEISEIYHHHSNKVVLLSKDGERLNLAFTKLKDEIKAFRASLIQEIASVKNRIA